MCPPRFLVHPSGRAAFFLRRFFSFFRRVFVVSMCVYMSGGATVFTAAVAAAATAAVTSAEASDPAADPAADPAGCSKSPAARAEQSPFRAGVPIRLSASFGVQAGCCAGRTELRCRDRALDGRLTYFGSDRQPYVPELVQDGGRTTPGKPKPCNVMSTAHCDQQERAILTSLKEMKWSEVKRLMKKNSDILARAKQGEVLKGANLKYVYIQHRLAKKFLKVFKDIAGSEGGDQNPQHTEL